MDMCCAAPARSCHEVQRGTLRAGRADIKQDEGVVPRLDLTGFFPLFVPRRSQKNKH